MLSQHILPQYKTDFNYFFYDFSTFETMTISSLIQTTSQTKQFDSLMLAFNSRSINVNVVIEMQLNGLFDKQNNGPKE